MKKFSYLIALLSFSSFACDGGFVQHNYLKIAPHSFLANDMTEKEFKDTAKSFEKFFAPQIEREHNAELQVYSSWASNTVNAYAERDEDAWLITIYGGLARHKAITLDGYKLVLCHELGHHLGGYPKKSTNKWSSAEGQADYFATMKCLRQWWENENNETIVSSMTIPAHVKNECALSYSDKKEQALCQRMSMAGRSVALLIQDLDQDSIEPKFETPDPLIVRAINYMHPYAQCRLDTFFNGAICPVSQLVSMENDNETSGTCHARNGDSRGLRPRCWFVPR